MSLHWIDIAIILAYIVLTIAVGFWLSRKASENMESYYLGGNSMPWYLLGVSNASGQFDISGTMWLVSLMFVYGMKSMWIPWLWPTFNQIFLMVFLSAWVRRSGVVTGAEWIRTRFGGGTGGQLSHIIVVVFALVSVIGFLAYGFIGVGKFAAIFFPYEFSADARTNAACYGLILTFFTTLYTVKGGMFSVVFTEVLQFVVMTVAAIAVGVIAFNNLTDPSLIADKVPQGWYDIFFGWELGMDWTGILDEVNLLIENDKRSLFAIFFGMMLFKGILVSLAGPAPNYDMQRILSARTPAEAQKMSFSVNVALFFPRYLMIGGLAVLAMLAPYELLPRMDGAIDFEQILPNAIRDYLPIGLKGLLIAGLLAAFMGTFAATVNAASAYVVNDIYKKYYRPNAPAKNYVRMGYLTSALVVVVGTVVGLLTENVASILEWIVSGLWGGYTAANVFKWYWWRFNAYGYFWGMTAGIVSALVAPSLFTGWNALEAFPFVLGMSVLACVVATLLTPPEPAAVLDSFYRRVRPWGFWGPVYERLHARDPRVDKNTNFGRDMGNVAVGMIWQVSMAAAAVFLILKQWDSFFIGLAVIAATSAWLYFFWWPTLDEEPGGLVEEARPTGILMKTGG